LVLFQNWATAFALLPDAHHELFGQFVKGGGHYLEYFDDVLVHKLQFEGAEVPTALLEGFLNCLNHFAGQL
jgi:hypothetical protein